MGLRLRFQGGAWASGGGSRVGGLVRAESLSIQMVFRVQLYVRQHASPCNRNAYRSRLGPLNMRA